MRTTKVLLALLICLSLPASCGAWAQKAETLSIDEAGSGSEAVPVEVDALELPGKTGRAARAAHVEANSDDAPRKVEITKGRKATMRVGARLTLKAKLTPAGATAGLTWRSSNKKVATVSGKGRVTAKKKGTAKITVETANGRKASITITVRALTKKETRALYKRKVPTLDEGMEDTRISFLDMTGDGTEEALVTYEHYDPAYSGACVLTCRNGKVKKILTAGGYGMDRISFYGSTRTVLVHYGGRGHEYCEVYTFREGKFKAVATRTRDESEDYGGDYDSDWRFWDGADREISKAKYDALTGKLFKGRKTRLY